MEGQAVLVCKILATELTLIWFQEQVVGILVSFIMIERSEALLAVLTHKYIARDACTCAVICHRAVGFSSNGETRLFGFTSI